MSGRSLIVAAQNSAWVIYFGKKACFKQFDMRTALQSIVFPCSRLRTCSIHESLSLVVSVNLSEMRRWQQRHFE